MADLGELVVRLRADATRFTSQLSTAQSNIQKFGSGMKSVGSTLSKFVTVPTLALGAAAIKTTMDFDSGMSKVQAISGATGKELGMLRDKAKEMGAKTKFSATESAEAFQYMALAGWKSTDMLNGIEGVMNLAAASGEQLSTVSDIVTDSLTAFGMSAKDSSKFADLLASTSSNANTNVTMAGEAMKFAAPAFGAMGYSAEDAALAIGLMSNAGIKASMSGTSLRAGLVNLAKPTDAMKAAMDKYGISIKDSSGKMYSMRELMVQLREKFQGMEKDEQAATAATIFGKTAMSGWLAIINASDKDFAKLSKATTDYEGAASRMAETMQNNLGGQLTILKSTLEGIAIQFGEVLTPYVSRFTAIIQNLATKFSKLSDSSKMFIISGMAIAAVIPPIIFVAGQLITAFTTIAGVLTGITGVITIAIASFVAITSAIVFVNLNFDNLKKKFFEAPAWVKGLVVALAMLTGPFTGIVILWTAIIQVIRKFGDTIKNVISTVFSYIEPFISSKMNAIKTIFKGAFDAVTGIVKIFTSIFKGDFDTALEGVKTTVSGGLAIIKGIFLNFTSNIRTAFTTFAPILKDVFINAFNSLKSALPSIIESVKSGLVTGFEYIKSVVSIAIQGAVEQFKNIFAIGLALLKGDWVLAWEGIKVATSNSLATIQQVLSTILEAISISFAMIKESIATKIGEWKEVITTKLLELQEAFNFVAIKEFVLQKFEELKILISEKLSTWKEIVTQKIEELQEAFKFENIKESISQKFEDMKVAIIEKLGQWKTSINAWIKAQDEENKRQFGAWKESIKQKFEETKTAIVEKLNNWWTSISTWFASIPSKIKQSYESWKTAIKQKFDETKADITKKLSEWWTSMSTWFSNLPSKIKTGFDGMVKATKQAFEDARQTITTKLNEWWSTLRTWFSNLGKKPEIKESGKKAIKTLTDGAKEQQPDMMEKIGQFVIKAFKYALTVAGVVALATGRELIKMVASGISQKIGDVKTAVSNVGNTIKLTLGNLANQAYNWGAKVIGQFKAGLDSKIGAIKDSVSSVASTVANFFPHSPAKEGALKEAPNWGKTLIGQLTDGIYKNIPKLKSVASQMSEAIDLSHFKQDTAVEQMFSSIKDTMQKTWDETVSTTKSKLNNMADVIKSALTKQYDSMYSIEEKKVNARLDLINKMSEQAITAYNKEYEEKLKLIDKESYDKLKAVQSQIDAINKQTDDENKILEQQERVKKKQQLLDAVNNATTLEAKREAETAYNDYIEKLSREALLEMRAEKIENLKLEMEDIKSQQEEKKEALKAELDANIENQKSVLEAKQNYWKQELENYKTMIENKKNDDNIYAETRRLLEAENQEELLSILDSYYPEWQNAGQTFADKFMNGFNSVKKSMASTINDITSMVSGVMGTNIADVEGSINRLSSEWTTTIEKMRGNSIAWQNTSSESTKARLAQENEQMGASLGLTKKNGSWYLPNGQQAYNIDSYASGGIFTSEQIIHLGEAGAEAVLPIEKLDMLMASSIQKAGMENISINQNAGAGNGTIQEFINLAVNLDGRTIARATAPHMVNLMKLQGV